MAEKSNFPQLRDTAGQNFKIKLMFSYILGSLQLNKNLHVSSFFVFGFPAIDK